MNTKASWILQSSTIMTHWTSRTRPMRCSELGSVLIVRTPASAPETRPICDPIRKPPPAKANEAHGEKRRRTPTQEQKLSIQGIFTKPYTSCIYLRMHPLQRQWIHQRLLQESMLVTESLFDSMTFEILLWELSWALALSIAATSSVDKLYSSTRSLSWAWRFLFAIESALWPTEMFFDCNNYTAAFKI